MKFTIHQGRHRALPLSFGLWYNKTSFVKDVYFDSSCKYFIDGEDMMDTNKLFGVGYFFNHHVDSARFGWRYNPDTQRIKISAYCYVNKERVITDLCELNFFTWYRLSITVLSGCYIFEVLNANPSWIMPMATYTVFKEHKKKWQFHLGLFFGGNKPAPNQMNIEMKNL